MNIYSWFKKPVLRRLLEPGQFRSRRYVTTLNKHGLTGSMGRVGACADNVAMESFFSLLQKTCWIVNAGQHETSFASPSSAGLNANIIASDANANSVASPPSNMKHSTKRK